MRRLITAIAFLCTLVAAHAADPVAVEIPPLTLSSSPAPLAGRLFTPATPPRAAIVMLHGCGGAYASDGGLSSRHQMWGEYLTGLGYAVLMLDSFTSRGLREICTVKTAERTIREADRVGDAYAALAFVTARLKIDASRVALLGWSHGGGTVLTAVGRQPAGALPFKAMVAFYPGCTTRAKRADTFRAHAPLLVLIGESDDWTPAAPCKALMDNAAARGEPVSIVVYPDAYHDFDSPGLKTLRVRSEVPNGARPGHGVTVAPDPQAREDAMRQVRAFFEKHLQ